MRASREAILRINKPPGRVNTAKACKTILKMSKSKMPTPTSALVDTDMDDELDSAEPNVQQSPDSNQENNVAPKRGRTGRKPASAKFSKAKAPARRTSGGAVVKKKKAAPKGRAAAKRIPLKEQTNIQDVNDTEEVDEFNAPQEEEADPIEDPSVDEQPAVPAKTKQRGRKPASKGPAANGKGSKPQPKATEKDGEFEYTPLRIGANAFLDRLPAANDATEPGPGRKGAMKEVPETQAEPIEVDPSSVMEEEAMPQSVYRQTSNLRAYPRPPQPLISRKRGGSTSDTEWAGNDPALRRKLGEMTKKFDNLEMRYNNLREIGIKEAEGNFERLKAQSELKTKSELEDNDIGKEWADCLSQRQMI